MEFIYFDLSFLFERPFAKYFQAFKFEVLLKHLFFPLPAEFSEANQVKYFAGGYTLLSRSIPLHHEMYQRKTKKSKVMLKFVVGKKKKKY